MKTIHPTNKGGKVLFTMLLLATVLIPLNAQTVKNMKKKILFVVTSHDKKGNTDEATGFYLSEVSHPWEVLTEAGYEIDFVSPKGGKAPVDGFNLGDPVNKKFWDNAVYRTKIENTLAPAEVNPDQYVAIHYAGGHGAMWDFADHTELVDIAARIYENNGMVSAVCHGPAGLVNIKLSNGKYLVDGKKINAFTNEEETAVKMDKVVPFLLESTLIERGAIFEKSGLWQSHVVADQRVITGQNPQSAKGVGEALLAQLKQYEVYGKHTRFEIKDTHAQTFRKVLEEYVNQSIATPGNLMAEAYYEQDKPTTLWLIERWENKNTYAAFEHTAPAQKIKKLAQTSLNEQADVYVVQDLAPLTKAAWRKPAAKADTPIVVMLFVDAQAGTQQDFKTTYDVAMPQFRSEPGVIAYQLSQVSGNPELFVTYEKFRNSDAFQYHLNFPPIRPVIDYLNTSIKKQPFQSGLHTLIEFAPLTRK